MLARVWGWRRWVLANVALGLVVGVTTSLEPMCALVWTSPLSGGVQGALLTWRLGLHTGEWFVLTIMGLMVAWTVAFLVMIGDLGRGSGPAVAGVLGGTIVGGFQMIALSKAMPRAWRWPLASGLSGVVVGPAIASIALARVGSPSLVRSDIAHVVVPVALVGAGGLAYGLLTALVLANALPKAATASQELAAPSAK